MASLHPDLFKNCQNLEKIGLSGNKLTEIPKTLLSNLLKLKQAGFYNNPFEFIDFSDFEKNEAIDSILFFAFEIQKIYNIEIIEKLKNLTYVDFVHYEGEKPCVHGFFFDKKILIDQVKQNCQTKRDE